MKDLVTLNNPKSPISESFRVLRTNIQFSSLDKDLRSILVTSSTQGEGKTTTICNLAITIAQSGKSVLLVDCDLRRPRIHNNFELNNYKGLTNILAEQNNEDDCIKESTIVNLSVLSSGPKPPNPSEVLGSKSMKNFIESMKEKYDYVLLDAAPVGLVTDGAILSTLADGVLLVAASGEVAIEAAKRSKELLENVNANILGVVLNKVSVEKSKYYKYYYNQYYYQEAK
ncbi:CpsD/CapB family tyrosine-protein kinase [Anaeromicrobium sediminis]|uniref:non-specific protein-tyrosine kinase n=1 Tax=Anaeromicrobium sediminis TaxID=1478221 RepID=A0A267MIJ9_9FIRM|nr:CpsD/CapB family tyrosine-protein kinase [Anaeromicrobium sediminis]PAB59399.1 capsular biosynthesis protein [Anaeromicrobium sediminis]